MKHRVVGIDYGLKRIGVAISDENKILATSLGVMEAHHQSKETIRRLIELLKSYQIEKIIVGYPLHLSGKAGLLADEVKLFITALQEEMGCPVLPWDERLSTVQAERSLKEGGMRRKKRAKIIDAVTAVILLQSYLGY